MRPAMIRTAFSALFALPMACHAGCDTNGPPVQTSAVPLSTGTILFEAEDTALFGQPQELFLFNAATHAQTDFTQSWGLLTPSNPHVSPDGNYVVFDAIANNRWDVYVWKSGAANVVSLTGGLPNMRYEDPSFTFDGQSVMVKRDFNIVEYPISFANPAAPVLGAATVFTTNGAGSSATEASGPWMSPDGRYVFFWRGSSTYPPASVRDIYVPTGVESQFSAAYSNFPVVRDFSVEFYVAHTKKSGNNDQIFLKAPSVTGTTPLQLPANACFSDNSDPAPVNDDYLLFSNDSGGNNYIGYIGQIAQAAVWPLSRIGLGLNAYDIRALSYTPYTLSPP